MAELPTLVWATSIWSRVVSRRRWRHSRRSRIEGFRLLGLAAAYHALGRNSQSSAALEQLGELPMHAYLNAQANAYCGNVDLAFEWLERAYRQRNAGLSQMKFQPLLRSLHATRVGRCL